MGIGTGSDVVISAERLGKSFLIGRRAERERYTALRDVVARSLRGFARSAADMVRGRPLVAGDAVEEFWALDDVSFEIRRGDVVGIIGRNGAGKSTLLKILSRITEPSRGRVCIAGRVASLLEVGTGFHPELSGRENIYLNGAILGMTRAEIRARFDAIVAFAEVERFLDTPVKRYSSGMFVRLAFAVAAHLEPEILVVDEVLAVGDAEFQKKCLGKMQDVAGHGRTVLFVSHNMAAIRKLCTRAILLAGGRVAVAGTVESAISRYAGSLASPAATADVSRAARRGTGEVRIASVCLASEDGMLRPVPVFGALEAALTLSVPQSPAPSACIWILIRNAAGDDVAMIMQKDTDRFRAFADGETVGCTIDIALAPGRHTLTVGLLDQRGGIVDWVDDAITFEVDERFIDGTPFDHRLGMTSLRARWSSERLRA